MVSMIVIRHNTQMWEKRDRVMHFRLTDSEYNALQARLADGQVRMVGSENRLARKIVLDFLNGKLVES